MRTCWLLPIATLALLAGVFPATAQARWEIHDNVTVQTGERIRFFGMPGGVAADCQAACAAEAACVGYNYVKAGAYNPGDAPVCYLFSGIGQTVSHPCCIVGYRVAIPPPGPRRVN